MNSEIRKLIETIADLPFAAEERQQFFWGESRLELLPLDGFWDGLDAYDEINARITGRIATPRLACALLYSVLQRCRGLHLEIGTLYGGTAVLAALAKPEGLVVAMDPLTEQGYYGGEDPLTGLRPTVLLAEGNALRFELEQRILFIDKPSHPLRINAEIESAFIDGDHALPGVLYDWLNLRGRVERYIFFDNIDHRHPDIVCVYNMAVADPAWRLVGLLDGLAAFERAP